MRWISVLLVLFGLFGACSGRGAEEPRVVSDSPDPSLLACKTNDDCAAVDMGCCHFCNPGGWVIGVNKAKVDLARGMYHDRCETTPSEPVPDGASDELGVSFSGTSCFDCGMPTAGYCDDGRCTWATVGDGEDLIPQRNQVLRTR
jgi:hypothetical protein